MTVVERLKAQNPPVLLRLDDVNIHNSRASRSLHPDQQYVLARYAGSLAVFGFYHAGYIMSVDKCVFEPSTGLVFQNVCCVWGVQRINDQPHQLDS